MDQKLLRRSAVGALFSMLVIAVMLVSATYAWFTFNTSASVRGMEGSVTRGEGELSISNHPDGPFGESCDLVLTAPVEVMEPISTADLIRFYTGAVQNPDGITVLYRDVDEPDTRAIHGTVYLRADHASCNVYFWPEMLELDADAQVLAALRLGLRIATPSGLETHIFTLDALGNTTGAERRQTIQVAGTVVSAVDGGGRGVLVADPAKSLFSYLAGGTAEAVLPGEQALCALEVGETASVEYWLYLEGCDENCFDPVKSRDIALQLGFAGA